MIQYPTPHIDARPEDFAATVLMPGDPIRSKYIAKTHLAGAELVNNVRGIAGYTGTYKGVPVSVMASGMGNPSIGIYSYELFSAFGVENIIRVGSAGDATGKAKLLDVIYAAQVVTDSAFPKIVGYDKPLRPSEKLVELLCKAAEGNVAAATVFCSDAYYGGATAEDICALGASAVEMETAALYSNAALLGKNAIALLTISNSLVTGEELTATKRQSSFDSMIKLALETAISIK